MDDKGRWQRVDRLLRLALDEDLGGGDATSVALVEQGALLSGRCVTRAAGVLAGIGIVKRLYGMLDAAVSVEEEARDGAHIKPGQVLARIQGPARSVLAGERTALNLLQRMSGVATITRRFVDAVAASGAKIYDTRKTMPGMRALDKLAVYIGGGENHRYGLYDMILIKDNHLQLGWPNCPKGSVACAVARARERSDLPIMVEVETLDQLDEAMEMEPEMVLLDNMDPATLALAVKRARALAADRNLRRPLLEASGRVTLANVREVAEAGVDRISVGAITHSATALDIGLDLE